MITITNSNYLYKKFKKEKKIDKTFNSEWCSPHTRFLRTSRPAITSKESPVDKFQFNV